MRLFTELEPATYEEVQELVREGKYDSVEQFLRVAAQNQLGIEKSQGDGNVNNSSPTKTISSETERHYRWEYSPPETIPTRPPYGDGRSSLLLFSQYYRFFPLKCALYKLAELTADAGGPVPIEEARSYVATEIEPIRDGIVAWEKEHDIKKKNRKSTGLPKQDVKNEERSMERYLNHYVGKIQRQKEEPAGFGHDLGYVSFEQDGMDWNVQLTLTGSRFIQLPNPLLANGPKAPTLSEKEQAFVVTTIRNNLDEEYRFLKFVYNMLSEGDGSYTDHLDRFRDFLEESPGVSGEPSDNTVRSHAGGAISRMVELGSLERGARRGWYNPRRHPDKYEPIEKGPRQLS